MNNTKITNLKLNNRRAKEVIEILYNNEQGLTNNELSTLLNTCPSGATAIIQKYFQNQEPPLISIQKIGKYKYYTLTEEGKLFHESQLTTNNTPKSKINNNLEIILINNILNNIDSKTDDILLKSIKSLGINTITSNFTNSEFFFIALTLGIITPKPLSITEAAKLTMDDLNEEEYIIKAKQIYDKLKNIITKAIFEEREKNIFKIKEKLAH